MEFPAWSIIWISIALTTLAYALTQTKRFRSPSKPTLPPGPKPLPIIGNLLLLGDKPHRSLAALAESHGPIMTLKLGRVTTVVISSPELAREVLRSKDQAFCGRSVPDAVRVLRHHRASIPWLPAAQRWRDLRRLCSSQLFADQKLDRNRKLRQEKVGELVAYLRGCCTAGEAVDVGRAAFTTTLNLISNTLFSIDMVDFSSDSAAEFRDLMRRIMEEVGGSNISDFFPVLRGLDLQGRRRRSESLFRRLHEIFDELIDGRLEVIKIGSEHAEDFLDTLVRCHVDENGIELDRHAIKSVLTDLFVAGTDTSSSTVEWAMAELLRNPSSMAKARAELAATFDKDKEIDESEVLQLPYLHAVVKETLRLHPPVPFLLPRRTETSVELCGFVIPEHTRVLVNIWAIGRDENVWKDSNVFKPERFFESEVEHWGQDFELIPFGAGRRICPGLPLAFRMVHLMRASLLRSFNWELPDSMSSGDVDMTEKFGVTLALASPIRAVPILDT